MKHILNNISQEEKNRILEQHTGGKTIDTSKFKMLLESSLGNVKTLVSEGTPGTDIGDTITINKIEHVIDGIGTMNCKFSVTLKDPSGKTMTYTSDKIDTLPQGDMKTKLSALKSQKLKSIGC